MQHRLLCVKIDHTRNKSQAEWKKLLTPDEYRVLREKGTEMPGSGEYDKIYPVQGHFVCRACKLPLYPANAKFDSGSGWPSFDDCYPDAISTVIDTSHGMERTEICCKGCGSHLGHRFTGERHTKKNQRDCVNSLSLEYCNAET